MCYGGITIVQFIVLKSCRDLLVNNLFSSRISLPFLKKMSHFLLLSVIKKIVNISLFEYLVLKKRGFYNVNENHA